MNEFDLIKALCRRPGTDATTGLAKARAVLTDHITDGRRLGGRRSAPRLERRRVYVISAAAALTAVVALGLSVLPGMVSSGSGGPGIAPGTNGFGSSPVPSSGPVDNEQQPQDPKSATREFRYVRLDGVLGITDFINLLNNPGPPKGPNALTLLLRGSERAEMWVPIEPGKEWMIAEQPSGMISVGTSTILGCSGYSAPDYVPPPSALAVNAILQCEDPGDWAHPAPAFVAGLPADPGELLDRVYADFRPNPDPNAGPIEDVPINEQSPDVGAFLLLSEFLASPLAPAAAPTAIQAIERIPDVDESTDNGDMVLSLTDRDLARYELTVDPDTTLVHSLRVVALDGAKESGLVPGSTAEATLHWAQVTGIGTRPDGAPGPDDPLVSGITVPEETP